MPTANAAIALSPVPNQTVAFQASGHRVSLTLRTLPNGALLADVVMDGSTIAAGRTCLDRTAIIRRAYVGFPGDLAFVDTQGTLDPAASGLGTRYLLAWISIP